MPQCVLHVEEAIDLFRAQTFQNLGVRLQTLGQMATFVPARQRVTLDDRVCGLPVLEHLGEGEQYATRINQSRGELERFLQTSSVDASLDGEPLYGALFGVIPS